MKTKKPFSAPAPLVVATTAPTTVEADSLVFGLPENPSGVRSIDLTPWLGKGFDSWVWATAGQLRAFLVSKAVTTTTVVKSWNIGMRCFFQYLEASGAKFEPQSLEPRHILSYIGWIKDHPDWAYGSQKVRYDTTKSVVTALVRRKVIPHHEDLFPANLFPGSNSLGKGASPLSPSERIRLAEALRDDIIAIHKEQFNGTDASAMVVYLLAVAIRTGANTTPLLEASRDCLREHPFLPNMKLLELFKRRGNATKLPSLRYSKTEEGSLAIPMDGVALLTKALKLSEPLIAEAKPGHQDRVWLYRSAPQGPIGGKVTVLKSNTVVTGIAGLIERHNLTGDDGQPLRLNLSRLRKTLANRYIAISGGDLIATAALMGHDPKVADTHYLACTQQMRENATFVGEALADIYDKGEAVKKVIPILPGKSPTGRCKDPYQGDKAPKNGEPCDDFFSCFACKSYAVVGSPEDLHRLFSFYWFLEREMNHARTQDWREEFRNTMNLIDRFTADKFDAQLVADAKARAKVEPLKFWTSYTLSSAEVVNG
jgi:hypothetical protein